MADQDDITFIESPIEDIFDIESGTTMSGIQPPNGEIVVAEDDDSEEREIKTQLSTVYDYAVEAFESQTAQIQAIDPKYAARNAEVAAQYLKIALDSVGQRSINKTNKEKLKLKAGKVGPETVNQNLIVADRNELLKMLDGDN